jgi:hypothetical protein
MTMFFEKFIGALMLVFGIAALIAIAVGIIFAVGFFWVVVHSNLPVWGQYIFNTVMGGVILALIITVVSDDEPY